MVAFQEKSEQSTFENINVPITRTRKRKVSLESDNPITVIHVDAKVEPSVITDEFVASDENPYQSALVKFFLWVWVRKQNNCDQIHSRFCSNKRISSLLGQINWMFNDLFQVG